MSILYNLEFETFPNDFNKCKADFFVRIMQEQEDYFYKTINKCYDDAYKNKKIAKRIKIEKKTKIKGRELCHFVDFPFDNGEHIIFIELPQPHKLDSPNVYCLAYCIAYKVSNGFIDVKELYNIEYGKLFGTTCVGISKHGNHLNLGQAGRSMFDTVLRVKKIAFGESNK